MRFDYRLGIVRDYHIWWVTFRLSVLHRKSAVRKLAAKKTKLSGYAKNLPISGPMQMLVSALAKMDIYPRPGTT